MRTNIGKEGKKDHIRARTRESRLQIKNRSAIKEYPSPRDADVLEA